MKSPLKTELKTDEKLIHIVQKSHENALILGSGAFATSIASLLAHRFKRVFIKVRSPEIYEDLLTGRNQKYLPGTLLPSNIIPFLEWQTLLDALGDDQGDQQKNFIELIVSGLPTEALRPFHLENKEIIKSLLGPSVPFVCLAKGISVENLQLNDSIYDGFYPDKKSHFCFLSGPSFASEIVAKQATCVSIAGTDESMLKKVIEMMTTNYFKLFPTTDVKGVLLGGALKNVLAIAGGVAEGMGFNDNTRAAIITRGIEEMLRFGKVFGAKNETFYGPSGMGDLILTMTGASSRNKAFGLKVGAGGQASLLIHQEQQVVEGYKTTQAAYKMALKENISLRLFTGIYRILYENILPEIILKELMSAPVKINQEYWSVELLDQTN